MESLQDKTIAEIMALEEKFTLLLNEAMEQMRNLDGSISSNALLAIQSVYLKSAGFTEAACACNGQVMTSQVRPRVPSQMVLELYGRSSQICPVCGEVYLRRFPNPEDKGLYIHEVQKDLDVLRVTKGCFHGQSSDFAVGG
jgi:hypothetical protein